MIKRTILAGFIAFTVCGRASAEPKALKLGTLAPERSPWGQVFRAWSKAVAQKTGGSVELTWLWNGSTGPEVTAIGKIKSGQLAGAAVTGTGLATVYKPVTTLQIPGLFASWDELDRERSGVTAEVARAFRESGLFFGGWGDTGVGRVFSRGFAVKMPGDLRGRTPGYARESDIAPKLFEVIGGITPHPGSAGEVLGALTAGSIDVLMTSPLAAEQLQWASRLTHVSTMAVGFGIGGIVLGDRALEGLTPDERSVVESSAALAAKALTARIRTQDDESYGRVKSRLQVHETTPAEAAAWSDVFRETCKRVRRSLGSDGLAGLKPC
jgi:TRAP-type C4-dicarboxylate transport system substrate-binding protein